jgi:hypothetical protein
MPCKWLVSFCPCTKSEGSCIFHADTSRAELEVYDGGMAVLCSFP